MSRVRQPGNPGDSIFPPMRPNRAVQRLIQYPDLRRIVTQQRGWRESCIGPSRQVVACDTGRGAKGVHRLWKRRIERTGSMRDIIAGKASSITNEHWLM